jgi:hypothetical protein
MVNIKEDSFSHKKHVDDVVKFYIMREKIW